VGALSLSIEQLAPNCRIVYDKFHVMQHANRAIDELRRAEFFRRSAARANKGQTLAATRQMDEPLRAQASRAEPVVHIESQGIQAYLLKESLDRLWTYRYAGAMVNHLQRWIDQLRWQRLKPFQKLAEMLVSHLDGF
jgi:transposase